MADFAILAIGDLFEVSVYGLDEVDPKSGPLVWIARRTLSIAWKAGGEFSYDERDVLVGESKH